MCAGLKQSWRRLLWRWVLMFSFFSMFAPTLGLAYYAVWGSTEFDQLIQALKGGTVPAGAPEQNVREVTAKHGKLVVAVRIGGHSWHRTGTGYESTTVGLMVHDPRYNERTNKISGGVDRGTSQATYMAWFQGRSTPELLLLVHDVIDENTEEYEIHLAGIGFLGDLAWTCALVGGLAVFVFELVPFMRKRFGNPRATSAKSD